MSVEQVNIHDSQIRPYLVAEVHSGGVFDCFIIESLLQQ